RRTRIPSRTRFAWPRSAPSVRSTVRLSRDWQRCALRRWKRKPRRFVNFKTRLTMMTEPSGSLSIASSKIAFIFPGQGSQTVGMGKDLAEKYSIARQTFEEADEALGYKLSEICFAGPEEQLRLTEITQPAILTA